jgi:hypothetical protein
MTDSDMMAAVEELATIKARWKARASKAGKARAKSLTKRQRSAIARKAGLASGESRRNKDAA